MKKTLVGIICGIFASVGLCMASDMTFTQGIAQKKTMAVYLYADWADNAQQGLQIFKQMEQKYSKKYAFVTLNIADADARSFNKTYSIYPNLPYVMLFRDGVRFSRFLNKDCIMNTSCFAEKLDSFVN